MVLGLDTNLMAEATATGLFAPHGVDTGGLDLPVAWTDATFVPFDWGWFAFVYDATQAAEAAAEPRGAGRREDGPTIVIEDPRTSTPGLGLLVWMREVYGDEAADAWRKLAPKIVTVTQGWSEAYGLFLKGEADMVLSYTTSPAYHIAAEDEDQVQGGDLSGRPLPAGRGRRHDEGDRRPRARPRSSCASCCPSRSSRRSRRATGCIRRSRRQAGLPASFEGLGKPAKVALMPPEEVEQNRRAWVDEWLAAMSR